MNGKDLLCAMGHVEDRLVDEAAKPIRSGSSWLRPLAVAACVCVVLAGLLALSGVRSALDMSATNEAAAQDKTLWWEPEGYTGVIEEGMYDGEEAPDLWPSEEVVLESIDRLPQAPVADTQSKDVRELTFEEACGLGGLGQYVPRSMPEKYTWGSAQLHRMVMEDGSTRQMLRLSYFVFYPGETTQEGQTTGGMRPVTLYILDFAPDTDFPVYEQGQVPENAEGFFYICHGDAWIGLSLAAEDRDTLLSVIGG